MILNTLFLHISHILLPAKRASKIVVQPKEMLHSSAIGTFFSNYVWRHVQKFLICCNTLHCTKTNKNEKEIIHDHSRLKMHYIMWPVIFYPILVATCRDNISLSSNWIGPYFVYFFAWQIAVEFLLKLCLLFCLTDCRRGSAAACHVSPDEK